MYARIRSVTQSARSAARQRERGRKHMQNVMCRRAYAMARDTPRLKALIITRSTTNMLRAAMIYAHTRAFYGATARVMPCHTRDDKVRV